MQTEDVQMQPQTHHGRNFIVGLGVVVGVLLICYLAACFYFTTHFVPGTTVNGRDVSLLSTSDFATQVENEAKNWSCKVQSKGGFLLELSGADIKLSADGIRVSKAAFSQRTAYTWPLDLLHPQAIVTDDSISYDEEALKTCVSSAIDSFNKKAEAPTNAAASYDMDKHAFVVSADAKGTALDSTKSYERITVALSSLSSELELGKDELLAPSITSDNKELLASCDVANKLLEQSFPLVKGDKILAKIEKKQIASWVSIDSKNKINYDRAAIDKWNVENIGDEASFEDDEGVYALDQKAMVDAIVAAFDKGKATEIEVPTTTIATKPAITPGASKRGRHLDINLSTQYARFYNASGKVIWETYLVSGDLATSHGTPTGEFAIQAKQRNQTLIGDDEDKDGKPDYKTFVSYWMPFRSGGYGLHDAPWRAYFGGDIYQYAGSHGCLNLPPLKAETLYNLVVIGDPVVVHW